MKITLVSLEPEIYSYGLRILSSCLREKGHDTRMIFMLPDKQRSDGDKFRTKYDQEAIRNLLELCSDSGLIGISLMSNQFMQAIQITESLKANGTPAPIIWGGVQPTVEPEECLEFADIVCLGEGEEALVELANRMECGEPYLDTRNMWFKTKENVVRNPLRPLIQDLDVIPFPDYSFKDHFIIQDRDVKELTVEKFLSFQGERFRGDGRSIPYMFMTSRGCPSSCTYCGNSAYKRLYAGQNLLRWRSDNNIIEELRMIQREVAQISYLYMVDDNFTARSEDKLRAFCETYKNMIGVPFFAQVSPLTISDEKMEILFGAGCAHITMGVETASARVARTYNRSKEHKVLPAAIALVEKYRSRMNPPPTYQFIIDNPYETLDEMLETLRLAVSFPRPWYNPIYSLMLFPGVPLYRKALRDGVITDKYAQIYTRNWHSQSRPFFQFWIRLYHANFPPFFLKMFLTPWIAKLMSSNFVDAVWKMRTFRWLWEKSA
ncbi:MAG: B12 binding domain protein [Syntrophorhabdus sp. PtaB.Bin006]|nr:MAG: B12 binding domain protein [Syntrophorhabdus sp. PtaB.Bin006]